MPGFDRYSAIPAVETLPEYRPTVPEPLLATGYKLAPDGKSMTLTLRKGVKFHDGTDFDAEAVKFNLDLWKKELRPELQQIVSIDVLDSYTVRLNLSQYDNSLPYDLATAAGQIVSPTAIKTKGKDWAIKNPVGTGPFKFTSYDQDVKLKYQRFEDYWQKGKPYLDAIEISYVSNSSTAAAALQAGQSDLMWGSGSLNPKLPDDLKQKGLNVATIESTIAYLLPDSKNTDSPFAKKDVREAVEYAIDRQAIVKALSYGIWQAANQPVPPGFPWENPDIKGRAFNQDKARQLLADAGYAKGFETSIKGPSSSTNKDAVTAIQNYLSQVGIKAQIDLLDSGAWTDVQKKGWKNAIVFSVLAGSPGNYGANVRRELPADYTMYPSVLRAPGYEAALVATTSAFDFDTQKKASQALSKFMYDDAMITPLWSTKIFAAKQPTVRDDYHATWLHLYWRPGDAWLSK